MCVLTSFVTIWCMARRRSGKLFARALVRPPSGVQPAYSCCTVVLSCSRVCVSRIARALRVRYRYRVRSSRLDETEVFVKSFPFQFYFYFVVKLRKFLLVQWSRLTNHWPYWTPTNGTHCSFEVLSTILKASSPTSCIFYCPSTSI